MNNLRNEFEAVYGVCPRKVGSEEYAIDADELLYKGFCMGVGGKHLAERMLNLSAELKRLQDAYDTLTTKRAPKIKSVVDFLQLADSLLEKYPYLYVEIARTRQTDFMVWLRSKPEVGTLLAHGQGSSAEEACRKAVHGYLIPPDPFKDHPPY